MQQDTRSTGYMYPLNIYLLTPRTIQLVFSVNSRVLKDWQAAQFFFDFQAIRVVMPHRVLVNLSKPLTVALAAALSLWPGPAAAERITRPTQRNTSAVPGRNQIEIWKIRQDSHVTGGHTVYVSADAVKDINERSGMIVICKAPDWKVVSYQPSSKCVFSQDLSRFSGYLQKEVALFSGNTLNHITVGPTKKSTFLGQEAMGYSTTSQFTEKIIRDYGKHIVEGNYPAIVKIEALNTPTPKQAELLCKVYGLPKVPGLPLTCQSVSADKYNNHLLTTNSLTKSKVPATFFDVPPGLKPVATMTEVIHVTSADDEGLMQLMDQKTTFDKTPSPRK